MDEVKLKLNEKGHGAFYVMENGEEVGEMVVSIAAKTLTVYHTEVSAQGQGKGFAKKLLYAMVDYARKNGMKVIPLCPFVYAQFNRHPDEYADLWKQQEA